MSNVIDISAIAIFGLGALTFITSVPTALAYAGLAGRYSGEIKASAEYDEFTSEKLADYQVAFNNGEMSKSEYLKKVDELDRGNIFSEFMKERATDEQVATYNDFDNKAVTAVSIMSSSVAVIGLCAILCKISENLSK